MKLNSANQQHTNNNTTRAAAAEEEEFLCFKVIQFKDILALKMKRLEAS